MKITRQSLSYFPDAMRSWAMWQKLRNPFAGLSFFTRCSDGAIQIVSRHWPHQLCWSWGLDWRPWSRRYFYRHNCGGSAGIGPFRFSWQNYDNMISSRSEQEALRYVTETHPQDNNK